MQRVSSPSKFNIKNEEYTHIEGFLSQNDHVTCLGYQIFDHILD
jgi:hypothetical protein